MRATLYTGNPTETEKIPDIPGIWAEYAPRTNLVWLLFILKNLLRHRKPETETAQPPAPAQRRPLAPCSPNKAMEKQVPKNKPTKAKDHEAAGAMIKDRQNKNMSMKIAQLKQTLEDRLNAVLDILGLEHGHEDMCCAADLVAYAMDSQWLAEQDFF